MKRVIPVAVAAFLCLEIPFSASSKQTVPSSGASNIPDATARVTRLRSDLAHAALDADLVVTASKDQSVLSNVRQPDHMAGDLHAQRASAEVGAQRLASLMDSHGLDDIEGLADEIISRSEEATRRSIRALPAGTVRATSVVDLADGSEITVAVAITVDPVAGEILVDYEGSSGASPFGINVVLNYTHAYTTFTVRSVLNPELPNNHGSLAPIKVVAPVGSIVHAVSPQPCTARHVVGMFLPNALLKALAQLKPEQSMAEGSGAVWTMQVSGNHPDGSPFITAMFTYAGGVGARAAKPGLSACSFCELGENRPESRSASQTGQERLDRNRPPRE